MEAAQQHAELFEAGDLVGWIAERGMTTGRVVRQLTSPEWVGPPGRLGKRYRASPTDPLFLVEAEISGAMTACRPEQLTRLA